MTDLDPHLVPLGTGGWALWRDALLRSSGFPVDGPASFAMPDAAAAADALLTADTPSASAELDAAFTAAFDRALAAGGNAVFAVASDRRFREAVTWQNPSAAATLDGILRDGPGAPRNERRRRREDLVAAYWQRYCLKNDTVGFFGPIDWVTVDDTEPSISSRPGRKVEQRRWVIAERWLLADLGSALADDPKIRRWLPVTLAPQVYLDEHDHLRQPGRPARPVQAADAVVLRACDGRAAGVVAVAVAAATGPYRRAEDVLLAIERLAAQGWLHLGVDLPMSVHAEAAMLRAIDLLPDAVARERANAIVEPVLRALESARTTTDPALLQAAFRDLAGAFERATGHRAQRRGGQTYAGRTACHLEAERDHQVVVGAAVIDLIAAPLEPLLVSARWLTARCAQVYRGLLEQIFEDLMDPQTEQTDFGELWFSALATIFGEVRPVDGVIEEFLQRWAGIFGLAALPPGAHRVQMSSGELAAAVAEEFDCPAPGWTEGRIHSPDVHLCASNADAIALGEVTAVLGEIHIGFPAFDTSFFLLAHPDPDRLIAATHRDFPQGRVLPAFPQDWPMNTSRNGRAFDGGNDVHLAFVAAPGIDRDRLVPVASLRAERRSGAVVVSAPDGRSWDLIEVFAGLLGLHTYDAWKLTGGQGHTPRVTVDALVLARETWRLRVSDTDLAAVTGERERYLAGRAFRRRWGMPERVFVRLSTEIKPFYVDLTSPLYVKALCKSARSALARDPDARLTVSELLPTPEDAWLQDAQGHRYCSELRFQVRDPVPARPSSTRH